jgi:hypothetical protein
MWLLEIIRKIRTVWNRILIIIFRYKKYRKRIKIIIRKRIKIIIRKRIRNIIKGRWKLWIGKNIKWWYWCWTNLKQKYLTTYII